MTPNSPYGSEADESAFNSTVSAWHEAVPRLTNRLTDIDEGTHDCHDSLADDLNCLIDTAQRASEPDWNPGDPCPQCGSGLLNEWVETPELVTHSHGSHSLRDAGRAVTTYAWVCGDCETNLRVSPAALLLPVAPGVTPPHLRGGIVPGDSALQSVFSPHLPDPSWQTGSPCPFCAESVIRERPLTVRTVRSCNGEYSPLASSERLTTTSYHCDHCDRGLRRTQASLISDSLSLAKKEHTNNSE